MVRVLGSSSNIRCSEFAEYALQQLLQHYTAPKLLLLDSQQVGQVINRDCSCKNDGFISAEGGVLMPV
jgi:hypothetical protein